MKHFSFYRLLFVLIISFFFLNCKKPGHHLTNLNNNVIGVLGHRGSGVNIDNTYPINTMESIEVGIDQMGADGMEIDAQLSKDKQLILYHDTDLVTLTSFSGLINSYTRNELSKCVINSDFYNSPFKEYHLAALEEVFEQYKNYSPTPICYIDVKPYYDAANFQHYADFNLCYASTMNALISKYYRQEYIMLSSVDNNLLQQMKIISPSLKLLVDESDFDMAFRDATTLGLYGMTINYKNITREQVIKAHDNNLRVILWGVSNKAACRTVLSLFPDFVETDEVLYMLSLTKR
jgi:glycerophosphoryl diester phosphodiesterase